MKHYTDKVVWITGASSGFGEAMAHAFANEGAKVILSARREVELKRVQSAIVGAIIHPLDLNQPEKLEDKVRQAIAFHGKIDLVIHNGGIAQNSLAIETEEVVQRKIMEVDFFSYTLLTRYLLPHFIQNKSGHIVVISGVLAKVAMPLRSSYCAAKAALHGYFDSLRAEQIAHNIAITIVVPSFLKTNLSGKALQADGTSVNKNTLVKGCSVEKAAQQVLHAVKNKKYQTIIGNYDKGRLLEWLSRMSPNFAIKMVLKQTKTS